jgi:tripartite-type tricarboxylate transporter receptor subunit TctC
MNRRKSMPGIIAGAPAADYPAKSIRLIIPSSPGGAPDIFGRLIAGELGKQMGQQVVVDNRPGASGIIGFEAMAKAPPDGYTFGYQTFPFVTNPSGYAKLPYDTARDFQPVVRQGSNAGLMTVTPSLPVQSVRELIEYARAQPGKLSYGSNGGTASNALIIELLKVMTGTQIVQVSYKGMQQAITDTIAGQVHIVCDSVSSISAHTRSGRLRVLAVSTLKRLF